MHERTLNLLEKETFETIQNTNVLLIGIGGVGGYVLESLIRTGFLHLTIVDEDYFEESNLNRQILAVQSTLLKSKIEIAKQRVFAINPNCKIVGIQKHLTKEDITPEFLAPYHYVIDACDTKEVKIALIMQCKKFKKQLISCMGTANKTHPELFEITTLKKTKNDPLARTLRSYFKNNSRYLNTPVVCSTEVSKKQKELGTIACVPMTAGALLSSFVINNIKKETSV